MVAKLAHVLPDFEGQRSRGRCFAHIINLVVKSILQLFEKPGSRGENETTSVDEGSCNVGTGADNDGGDGDTDDIYVGEPDKTTG